MCVKVCEPHKGKKCRTHQVKGDKKGRNTVRRSVGLHLQNKREGKTHYFCYLRYSVILGLPQSS
jgi:hypothetical protein